MNKGPILGINDLDGRQRAVRRAKALTREFAAVFGGKPAPHPAVLIRSAAELTAIAEQARALHMAGGTVDLNDIVRVEGAMARAIRTMHLSATSASVEEIGAPPVIVISAADARL
jgi:hypothetical protein